MARTIPQIKQIMLDKKAASPELAGLTSTSQTAIWNLIFFICAVAIFTIEVLVDIFKDEMIALALENEPGTRQWVRKQALYFQYSATTPQFINLVNFAPVYPVEDASLRIVTQCSVKQDENRDVIVKLAKGTTTLAPLSNTELTAFASYLNFIKFAGTAIRAISLEPDRVKFTLDLYYDPQFPAASTKALVITAITEYLKNIPFDGVLLITKLIDAIQLVPGVKDVQILTAIARQEQVPFGDPASTTFDRSYETVAGYIIPEDETGETLDDTGIINMIPA